MECSIKQQVTSIVETCRWLRKISAISAFSNDIHVLSLLFKAWVSFLMNCSSLLLLFSRTSFTSFPQAFWEIFTAEAHRPGELSYLEHSMSLWSQLGFLCLIIWAFRGFSEQPVCDTWTRSRKIPLWHGLIGGKRQFPTHCNRSSLEPSGI